MDSIKITLETLYDILRNEKKREDLQKLDDTFFIDVVSYLREKQMLQEKRNKENDLFAAGERDKLEYELRSIKRILKETYEKREQKIIEIALNRSKTGSEIIDTSSMLREEREFYDQLLQTMNLSRQNVLLKLIKGELPNIINYQPPKPELSIKEKSFTEKKSETDAEVSTSTQLMTKIRFIHPTPSFVWKDMKVYGPFDIGEETEIFPEVAELLVRKKRAEKV